MNYNLNIYNDPILARKRRGTVGDPYKRINETLVVHKNYVVLTEIPNRYEKVKVTDSLSNLYFEIEDGELTKDTYKVDYTYGVVFFHESLNGKSLTFSYLGEGALFFPDSRIYLTGDDPIGNVREKFKDIDRLILEQKNRVDTLIRENPQPSEVVDMRVDRNGKVYSVAKERIDAEQKKIEDAYVDLNGKSYPSLKERINAEQKKIEDAYINSNGTIYYNSLKERLDTEYNFLFNNLKELETHVNDISNVKSFGAVGNANYYNANNGKWYEDSNYTIEAKDNTEIFQEALNKTGVIIIPTGNYLVGTLQYKSNTIIVGVGNVKLIHNPNAGFKSNFPRAMITNSNLPEYHKPESENRTYVSGLNKFISIENILFDGNNTNVWGIQAVAVDNLYIKNVRVENTYGGIDLRAVRNSYVNAKLNNIYSDGFSVTDQNFLPLSTNDHKGISQNIIFDKCIIENSCYANTPGATSDSNAFEMDDGMRYVFFNNCIARNNYGSGFRIHLHTSDYDMSEIYFNNCLSENNVPISPDYTRTISGFSIGQTPDGSKFTGIYYNNCISVGNPIAFEMSAGAQQGSKGDVYINGGRWESSTYYSNQETRDMNNSVFLLKKLFRNVVITNAIIKGNSDGFGIYTYTNGDGLTVKNCNFLDTYIPLRAGHYEGNVVFKDNIINSKAETNEPFSAFMYFNVDTAIVSGNIFHLNSTKYSSSIIRFVQVENVFVSDNLIVNNTEINNNGIQIDQCGSVIIHNNIIKKFTNAIFLSNDSTSVIVHNNDCKTCTNVINRYDAPFLLLHHNTTNKDNNMGWQSITLKNGWTTQSSREPRFRVNDDGIVYLSFAVGGGSLGTVIGTIPKEYAPKRGLTLIGYTSSSVVAVVITIDTDGNITIPTSNNSNANTSFISLEASYSIL